MADDLLDAPVARVVARLAREHLARAASAAKRLNDPDDGEALHDFRVALRRLRSLLRAYRAFVSVPRRLRRQLKRLTRATNRARDIEVMIGWIVSVRRTAGTAERVTLDGWRHDLEGELAKAYSLVRDEAREEFAKLRRRFEVKSRRRVALKLSFREATARLVDAHAQVLAAAFATIESVAQAETIHAARIEAKRLRYLIEPLVDEQPPAAAAVRAFKDCQDRFGALCDAFVRARELADVAERLGARRAHAEIKAALAQLARRMHAETRRLFAAVESHYLKDGAARLFVRVEAVRAALAEPDSPARRRANRG